MMTYHTSCELVLNFHVSRKTGNNSVQGNDRTLLKEKDRVTASSLRRRRLIKSGPQALFTLRFTRTSVTTWLDTNLV